MTNDEIFTAWSPEESRWAAWAKPVLFCHMDLVSDGIIKPAPAMDISWAPETAERCALVLDLPADEGVWTARALAARGYRPVPLYNAVPLPMSAAVLDWAARPVSAVNVMPIVTALRAAAEALAQTDVPTEAPPAFLLDANRRGDGLRMRPGQFDNRSVCFTTDFPSANFLLTHGITRVLLVQRERLEAQSDLMHVLRRWQDGGIRLERLQLGGVDGRASFEATRPSWYGKMFQRALEAIGLRRASGGGFGAWVPEPGSGG